MLSLAFLGVPGGQGSRLVWATWLLWRLVGAIYEGWSPGTLETVVTQYYNLAAALLFRAHRAS